MVILRKLLAALTLTKEPMKADLVVIPALAVTVINGKCRNGGSCENLWYSDLESLIKTYKVKLLLDMFIVGPDCSVTVQH